MKRTLSLMVAVLLALAVIPMCGIVSAKTDIYLDHSDTFSESHSDTVYGERHCFNHGDNSHIDLAKYEQDFTAQRDNPHLLYNEEEAERLYPFYFDYIDSEVSDYYGLFTNIDRLYGFEVSGMEEYQDPNYWYLMNDEGNCSAIIGSWGALGGYGLFEGDLDVSGFSDLEYIQAYPNFLNSVDASDCPSLEAFTVEWYDGLEGSFIWNEPVYWWNGDWDPQHHMQSVDLSNCPSLYSVNISWQGAEEINLEGSLGSNIHEIFFPHNQLSGEVPDLSAADNLEVINLTGNNFTGTLTLDSQSLFGIITEEFPESSVWYGDNNNSFTDINIVNSAYGPKHFSAVNGYIDIDMNPQDHDGFYYIMAYPAYPDYECEFLGWFDADMNLFSPLRVTNITDYYEAYDLTAVFTNPYEQPTVPLTGIDLDVHEATLEVDETIILHAMPLPDDATHVNYSLVWHNSNEDAVTMIEGDDYDDYAVIWANAPGTADITLTAIYTDPEEDFDYVYVTHCIITVVSGEEYSPGDVDMDGTVTVSDALLAMRQAMGILQLTDGQLALADFDGNGVIDVSDALLIMRRSMGLI